MTITRSLGRIAARCLRWTGGLLALLLTASALFPELTQQLVAHAAPDVSLYYNWFASMASGSGTALAIGAAATSRDLKTILGELVALQEKWKGKRMPEDEAAKFDELALEAKALQDEAARSNVIQAAERFGNSLKGNEGQLPPDRGAETPEQKTEREARDKREIAGYVSLGDYVTLSEGFRGFHEAGMPKAQHVIARGPDGRGLALLQGKTASARGSYVGLTNAQLRIIRDLQAKGTGFGSVEAKAIPTIDDSVIMPQRLSEVVRVLENERLTLRDVIDVQRTTSNAIEYVRLTNYTRAAAAVAHAGTKPQASLALDSVSEVVRTIAVWIPVNNQQLEDLPALSGMINGELLYDVNKHVEELVMYGDGTGQEFNGIIPNASVLPIGQMPDDGSRIEEDDTLIDIARRGITDVRVAGYEPNAILVDPLDWEDIVLEKGSDNRYVWVVVTEDGVQRLWGVPVIETSAMQDFAGDAIERRHMVVGDFRRGATLYDRTDANISVGWVNDQFIKNQRTILAELRAAFALKRPGAFRKYETAEGVAS